MLKTKQSSFAPISNFLLSGRDDAPAFHDAFGKAAGGMMLLSITGHEVPNFSPPMYRADDDCLRQAMGAIRAIIIIFFI